MARECEHCGETFKTLTSLRLHDCPQESRFIEDAFLPEPQPRELPDRVLTKDEFEQLKSDSRVNRVTKMLDAPLPGDRELISFVIQIGDSVYGLHCDHDTMEWKIVAEGTDFEKVEKAHKEWLADDIGRVTGDAPDPENVDKSIPEKITTDCDRCDGTHELTAQPDSFPAAIGLIEYEGFCEETDMPIIVTKDPDDLHRTATND